MRCCIRMSVWAVTYTTWRVAIPSTPHVGGGDHPLTLEEVAIPPPLGKWPSPHFGGGDHPLTLEKVTIPFTHTILLSHYVLCHTMP